MTGSRLQLYNGCVLLLSFFSCRLIYGTYSSICMVRDVYAAINFHPTNATRGSVVMAFATNGSTVQPWLAASYFASNFTLNSLNFYWFFMMVHAVRKRFRPHTQSITEVEIDLSSVASGVSKGHPPQRRREHIAQRVGSE